MNENELRLKSIEYRKTILEIIHRANAGHTGGSLSCIDILNVLYNSVMKVSPDTINHPDRDRRTKRIRDLVVSTHDGDGWTLRRTVPRLTNQPRSESECPI